MFALINRSSMKLVCKFNRLDELLPQHRQNPFIVVNLSDDLPFRVFTDLELKLLYRSLGMTVEAILKTRDQLVAAVLKLMSYKLVGDPAQGGVFTAETEAQQAPTGRDREVASTVAPAPKGGVRQAIWDHADAAWQAAGSPTDKAVVLQLRKQMMIDLEAQGVKKSSSSNELGNWMKDRVPS